MAISESLHWYDRTGAPRYDTPYADPSKGVRPTTLRDAKKHSYVPSVSAILNIPAKPGLDRWKQNQLLDAAYSCQIENEKDWRVSVLEIANEVSVKARDKGTAIHAAIEKGFMVQEQETEMYLKYFAPVRSVLNRAFEVMDWTPEDSFAHPMGFGGKVDLHTDGIVIDFKTKDFTEDVDPKKMAYPENAMQLDAYRHGLKMPNALMVNVFIDRETGIVKLYEWPEDEKYFKMFTHLLEYWKLKSNYDSSFNFEAL